MSLQVEREGGGETTSTATGTAADICTLPPPPARVLVSRCGHILASPPCTGLSGHLSWALRAQGILFLFTRSAQPWLPKQSHHAGLETAVCGREGAGQVAFASERVSLQNPVSLLQKDAEQTIPVFRGA